MSSRSGFSAERGIDQGNRFRHQILLRLAPIKLQFIDVDPLGRLSSGIERVDVGTKFVADMLSLRIYWTAHGRRFAGFVADGCPPPDDDVEMIYSTLMLRGSSSRSYRYVVKTGDRGHRELAKAYGQRMRIAPDEMPVVEFLGFEESDRGHLPCFRIVSWAKELNAAI